MPTAVLAFDFDPLVHLGDGTVRWETIGVAAAIFAAIVLAGVSARSHGLRVDDLLFVVLGVVPGAVVGGRLGYVLIHVDFFGANPARILDPGIGSLELTMGVVGGTVTGALVALLLDGRPGGWMRVATLPTLLVLALGKVASVAGGTGQGLPTSGEPATAYLGAHAWGSLGPAIPSIPSQAIEAIATGVVLLVVLALSTLPALRRPDGRLFLLGIAGWATVRTLVAATWRDPTTLGPLRTEQLIAIVVAVGALGASLATIALRRDAAGDDAAREPAVEWPTDATFR